MSAVLESKFFRRVARVRLVCGVLAMLTLAGFLATPNTSLLVMYNDWACGLSGSCIEIGSDPAIRQFGPGRGAAPGIAFVAGPTWMNGHAAAWRPFRAGGKTSSRLMMPLWQPLLASAVVAALAHGMIVGARRADRGACLKCGYSLGSLPTNAPRRCPECGETDTRTGLAIRPAA